VQLGYGESQMLDKLLYEEEVKRCMQVIPQNGWGVPAAARGRACGRAGRRSGGRVGDSFTLAHPCRHTLSEAGCDTRRLHALH